MNTREQLLQWERTNLQNWLDAFDCAARPRVVLQPSGATLTVSDFPLPDRFVPDRIDIALVVQPFPMDPPKGIYILKRPELAGAIGKLHQRFNVLHGRGFHGAPSIAGFEWICVGYLDGWRYNARLPHKGDNVQKMLAEFWRLLEE
jgi:hypothetical protein